MVYFYLFLFVFIIKRDKSCIFLFIFIVKRYKGCVFLLMFIIKRDEYGVVGVACAGYLIFSIVLLFVSAGISKYLFAREALMMTSTMYMAERVFAIQYFVFNT